MQPLGNDRWQASFVVEEIGRYEYTVEGWIDRFGSWRHELAKKFGAGQDVNERAAGRRRAGPRHDRSRHRAGRRRELLEQAAAAHR